MISIATLSLAPISLLSDYGQADPAAQAGLEKPPATTAISATTRCRPMPWATSCAATGCGWAMVMGSARRGSAEGDILTLRGVLSPDPFNIDEVGKVSVGGRRERALAERLNVALGALYTVNDVDAAVAPSYGDHPDGAMLIVQFLAGS